MIAGDSALATAVALDLYTLLLTPAVSASVVATWAKICSRLVVISYTL